MSIYADEMRQTAQAMAAPGKGILAMDESNATCNKRFAKLGIPTTEERRRAYRELILKTPNLSEFISGAILYDETIRQSSQAGVPFTQVMQNAGMIVGIKVDTGAKDLAACPGEENNRRARWTARANCRVLSDGRTICQMAGCDYDW